MSYKKTSLFLLCCLPLYGHAFNGVFLTGSGQVSSAMGGVSLAGGMDRTSISDNPANLSTQAAGLDAQLSVLSIRSQATFLNQDTRFKSKQLIPIPGMAWVKPLNDRLNFGLSITGAGASVDYDQAAISGVSADTAKDNLAIGIISPSFSYNLSPNLSIGAALNLGVQQFRAKGVLAGSDSQGAPLFLSSHGNQWAYGAGGSIGATWHFQPQWWLGASYTSELHFSKLDGYQEDLLSSSQGRLNLPERYGIGIKHQLNPRLTLAADILRINWQGADGFGKNGSFNWQNQTVYRAGLDYQINHSDHLRFGYSHADTVVDANDTLVNFYANAVANQSWSIGYGHDFAHATLNLAYEYAVKNQVNGTGSSQGSDLSNHNHVLTVGFSKSF
jgi:long-chain fatty acid transport protein